MYALWEIPSTDFIALVEQERNLDHKQFDTNTE